MRRVALILLATVVGTSSIAVVSWAGALEDSKLALHVALTQKGDKCAEASPVPPDTTLTATPCSNFSVTGSLDTSYNIFLVLAQADNGIAGVNCGIDYNPAQGVDGGVDVFTWTNCGDLDFKGSGPNGQWPAAGSGNIVTWGASTNCQRRDVAPDGIHAVAGFFYMTAYSDDVFSITENKTVIPNKLSVADCNSAEFDLVNAGSKAGFGASASSGCNACVETCTTPVKRTTWGQIKGQFR